MNAIEFADATVVLGGRTVLRNLTLAIRQGEFVGVLGPNGAGKTTILRAVLGLAPVRRGAIRVLGAPARRGNALIGYVPQLRADRPAPGLDARAFVAAAVDGYRFGPAALPWTRPSVRAEVDRVLDLVGATALGGRPLAELSGGERQRLHLAQALLGRPRLLLLDEPLVSLDPGHQHLVVALARALGRELGIAVLFSAHELNPLIGSLDRVLYLAGGAAALGTVDEVVTGPVLSGLYRTPIDVVRVGGRVFVMAGQANAAAPACRQEAVAGA